MARHEIPTHLDVEDKILGPLTSKDAVTLLVGASVAYGVGTSQTLPSPTRLELAGVITLDARLFALLKIQGRPLEEWLLATLVYLGQPRRSVWKPRVSDVAKPHPTTRPGWYPYRPTPHWQRMASNGGCARRAH